MKSTMTLCMVPCLFHNVHTCCFWRSHHYLINKLSYKRNSFNEQVSTLRKMNKTISVIKNTISVKRNQLFSRVVESWKCTNTRNLCTVVSCSATQEIELFRMWLVTLCSKPWELCQLCVGLRPGSNWPIPALSLLVKASPVWLDKPCHGCFPLGPSSLGKHCLQCEWGSLSAL